MALIDFNKINNNSLIKNIVINYNIVKNYPLYSPQRIANLPDVKITTIDGNIKIANATHPIMIIPGLSYNNNPSAKILENLINRLSKDLEEFNFEFAY